MKSEIRRQTNWMVFLSTAGETIFLNLELDFIEDPELPDYPQPMLAAGDAITFCIMPNNRRQTGKIISIDNTGEVIELDGRHWRISPPTASDFVNPVRGNSRKHIRFVREEISD